MRVWRIEGPDGHGPFMGGPADNTAYSWNRAAKMPSAMYADLHTPPTPVGDGYLRMGPDWYCGFATLIQLERWFPKDVRAYFRGLPLALAEYDVPAASVDVGDRQVTFRMADAQIQHAQSLADAVIFD